MKKLILLILLSLTYNLTYSQVTFQWGHFISSYPPNACGGIKVIIDSTNTPLVLAGWNSWENWPAFLLYKLNPDGVVIWNQQSTNSCIGLYLFLDSTNNIYIAGTERIGSPYFIPFVAKYSAAGTALFYKHDSTLTSSIISSAWLDKAGNSYIESQYNNRFRILKYNSSGTVNWIASYGDHDSINKPQALTLDRRNNVLATGIVRRNNNCYLTILKLANETGSLLDTIEYAIPSGAIEYIISQVSVDNNSNVYLMGTYTQQGSPNKHIFIKYDSSYSVKWVKTDTSQYEFSGGKFIFSNDGSVICVCVSGVNKYDLNGNLLWRFPKGNITDMLIARDGYLYLTGSEPQNNNDFYTCKLNTNGIYIWSIAYNYRNYEYDYYDYAVSIAVDTGRNVFVHGTSNYGPGYVIVTLKYSQLSGIKYIGTNLPFSTHLNQNYPNPFNAATKISFDLNKKSNVFLTLFDINGREVFKFEHRELMPGAYEYEWNAESFSSGIYFARLNTGDYSKVIRMVLVK